MLQRCYTDVTQMLQRCYTDVTKMLQRCYTYVTQMLQRCYKYVTKMFSRLKTLKYNSRAELFLTPLQQTTLKKLSTAEDSKVVCIRERVVENSLPCYSYCSENWESNLAVDFVLGNLITKNENTGKPWKNIEKTQIIQCYDADNAGSCPEYSGSMGVSLFFFISTEKYPWKVRF